MSTNNKSLKNSTMDFLGNYGLVILLVFFMVLDGIGKAHIFNKTSTIFPLFVKGLISAILIIVFVFITKQKQSLVPFILLAITFAIGQWTLEIPFAEKNIIIFGKFLTPLLLITVFNNVNRNLKSSKRLFNIFEWVLVINSILILVGFLFDLKLFESYIGSRFGYNGLFVTSGVSSYCTIIALAYFFFAYRQDVWKNYRFWIFFLASAFIGTKVVYIGMLLFLIGIVLQLNFRYRKQLVFLIMIISLTIFYFAFFEFGLFAKITGEKGVISSVLSLRDELFLNRTWPYIQEHWNWINYLFGGITDFSLRTQMEVIDVFFFWGIIGAVIYFLGFFKFYFTFQLNRDLRLFFIFLAFLLLLSGNFFVYTTTAIFLLIFRERIIHFNSIKEHH